ncbi:5'-nucleotidase [Moraxella nonliquefaciens]|uniref:5'-nucleotidase n=1 Tax=Moraxella nonliquefaciens TaxID=478 RepID=UPI000A4E14B4|nr:5'-nucleotidase [Moraxella nonliquefaciens]
MAVNFSNTLIVAISATALFDLKEHDEMLKRFLAEDKTTAFTKFGNYMQSVEKEPLQKGAGYPLIKVLLNLNEYQPPKNITTNLPLLRSSSSQNPPQVWAYKY